MKILLLALLGMTSFLAGQGKTIQVRTFCFEFAPGARNVTVAGDLELMSSYDVPLKKTLPLEQQALTLASNKILIGAKDGATLNVWADPTIPANTNEVMIVLFPSKNKEKPYHAALFDDSLRSHPLGTFRIANYAPNSVRLVIGGSPVEIPSGKNTLVEEFPEKKANGQVAYFAYFKAGNEWKRVSTGFWDVIEKKRTLQIAYQNPFNNRLEIRGFEDSLPIMKALRAKQQG
ncbi:MAG: hypothetical protein Q7Q71_12470 [Verrucomicrobiota bacterium JB023]|nr:hypothetical protein [Verrucomicrobiota bacterium JB023]